jgi:flavin-dependent thymidylate synthase
MKATQIINTFSDTFADAVARVSFDNTDAPRTTDQIKRLNRFLVFNDHWSPLAHPMVTIITMRLPLHDLVQNKPLMAALNIHTTPDGVIYITAGLWGFLKLAHFLKSKELLEMMAEKAPVSVEHFVQHTNIKGYTIGKRLFAWADYTPRCHQWASFEIEAPIPIRTQDFKHKVGFIDNEVSRRYVSYEPSVHEIAEWRKKPESAKQGSGGSLKLPLRLRMLTALSDKLSVATYNALIAADVAPEQARFKLPQGMNTKYIRTGTREAFENYFSLRCAADAQFEIQQLATSIREQIQYQSA